ncbi:MAG: zf-TFIIB domain-containing protein [bacterium]
MLCPICKVDLLMTEKQGVEIDYCPKCRGIWLDRGELDKIIERSYQGIPQGNQPEPGYVPPVFDGQYKGPDGHHDDHHGQSQYGYRRKKNFLGELFDF